MNTANLAEDFALPPGPESLWPLAADSRAASRTSAYSKVLEQNHIPITHIAGTSVGSVFGAAYASGAPLARILAVSRTIRFRDIARWSVSRLGLASNHRLADLIERVFESKQFEDMKIPLAVVATDLATGDPVVFRARSFGRRHSRQLRFPRTVRTNSNRHALPRRRRPCRSRPDPRCAPTRRKTLSSAVSVGVQDGHRGAPRNMFQVVARAVSAAQKHQLDTWERHADLVIRPDVTSLAWDDFDRANEAIEAGAAAAELALPRIQKLLRRAEHSGSLLASDLHCRNSWLAETLR